MGIDDRLSAWARRVRSSRVEPPDVPVERLASPARRGWAVVVPLVAAACVVAVVLGGRWLVDREPDAVTRSPDTVPYTFHGLTLDVPASWPLNASNCGAPLRNTVLLTGGDTNLCLIRNPPRVSVVSFAHYPDAYLNGKVTVTNPTRTRVAIGGRRVTKITGTSAGDAGGAHVAKGDPIVVLLVPSLGISATIQSPDRGLVDRIAATAHFVRADANGCLARRTDLGTLPTGRPPARPGADTELIPGRPERVAVCRYDYGGIERSTALTGAKLRGLVRTLDGLPTGLSVTPKSDYMASIVCTRERMHPNGFTVVATYRSGPAVTVWVRLETCNLLGASNGTHTGRRGGTDGPLVNAMADLVDAPGWGRAEPAPGHYR